MDDETMAKWMKLVRQFGLSKSGLDPWDAKKLDAQSHGASHGEKLVIQFLLGVWDPGTDWASGKFDVIEALAVWTEKERDAFLMWAIKPWWP